MDKYNQLFKEWFGEVKSQVLNESSNNWILTFDQLRYSYADRSAYRCSGLDAIPQASMKKFNLSKWDQHSGANDKCEWITFTNDTSPLLTSIMQKLSGTTPRNPDSIALLLILNTDGLPTMYVCTNDVKRRAALNKALEAEGWMSTDKATKIAKVADRHDALSGKGIEPGSKVIFDGKLAVVYDVKKNGKVNVRFRDGSHKELAPVRLKLYDPSKGQEQFETPASKRLNKFEAQIAAKGIKVGSAVVVATTDPSYPFKDVATPSSKGIFKGIASSYKAVEYGTVEVELPLLTGGTRITNVPLDYVRKA